MGESVALSRPSCVPAPEPSKNEGKTEWRVAANDPSAAQELGRALGISPTIAQVLMHRGLQDPAAAREYLEPRLSGLTIPDGMIDRGAAADRLARAIRARERIAVFGDYDVDGTTSTAILCDALEQMGGDVVALVASRFAGGYGLSAPALERVRATGATLLVTCDCGSSDHPRVAAARAAGIDVIVVDHHLVPAEPLPANAFLNPHRPDCAFPYKGLSSAGLALSLAAAVRAVLGAKLDLRELLDLVALGTIADVAPLDGDNRRLVRAGLVRLAQPTRPGLVALREQARMRAGGSLGGIDVAFRLAPRLNAAGRLGDPAITVALLRARSMVDARAHAIAIEALNDERKAITRRITEEAVAQVREVYAGRHDGGIVVASEGWHRGVVGIVAARLVDLFDAPVLAIAIEDGVGHGSGRTPAGFPLYDAIKTCRDELITFGGHQAAAGLSVRATRVDALRGAFDDACRTLRAQRGDVDTSKRIDVVLDASSYPLPRASELALLEPLGASNHEPVVAVHGARVEDAQPVGDGHLKMVVRFGGTKLRCFGWEMGASLERIGRQVDVVGTLRPDDWTGGEAVELRLTAVL
ncbi:Single-stranded-DNA-specific exonuclease RecJ [Sandaracinus amylolyticus]|nr:Single-stranded-DNA-specific exonuclease RecJ [Sandaracinus amylolyticus]